jgi:hypothetical protein
MPESSQDREWTTIPPTEPGHYWWRENPADTASVVVLIEHESGGNKWVTGPGFHGGLPFVAGLWWPIRIDEPK